MAEPPRLVDKLPPPDEPDHVKILCFGLSRTGTLSLLYALKQFGYNPYHMTVASQRLHHMPIWNEALTTKYGNSAYCNSYSPNAKIYSPSDIAKIVRNFDVTMDIPTLMFMPELLEAFPKAKIILTHHPKGLEGWLPSIRLIPEAASWRVWDWVLAPLGDEFTCLYFPVLRRCLEIWAGKPWPEPWTEFDQDKEHWKSLYVDHMNTVREYAKEQGREILEFGPEMGWAPLAEFLGKEIPKGMPYPTQNKGDNVITIHRWAMWLRLRMTLLPSLMRGFRPFAVMVVGLLLYQAFGFAVRVG